MGRRPGDIEPSGAALGSPAARRSTTREARRSRSSSENLELDHDRRIAADVRSRIVDSTPGASPTSEQAMGPVARRHFSFRDETTLESRPEPLEVAAVAGQRRPVDSGSDPRPPRTSPPGRRRWSGVVKVYPTAWSSSMPDSQDVVLASRGPDRRQPGNRRPQIPREHGLGAVVSSLLHAPVFPLGPQPVGHDGERGADVAPVADEARRRGRRGPRGASAPHSPWRGS